MSFYITKASGEKELFDIRKFRRSLKRAGADSHIISKIARKIQKMPALRSTKEIYNYALQYLKKESPSLAARYNIKQALLELGPAGFPFEQFVAELFRSQSYAVATNQMIQGFCVEHEIDLIAQKSKKHFMVECKFHNRQKLKTDVKVTLYIKARFDDIEKAWLAQKGHTQEFHQAWVATNTKFTSEAIKYAECINIKLLGWSYPQKNNLQELIDKLGIHPITALVSLSRQQKRAFIKEGFVLCRDAQKHTALLKKLGFTPYQINKLVKESEAVCQLKSVRSLAG